MKTWVFVFLGIWLQSFSQVLLNGQIDNLSEMYEKKTVLFPMRDGIKLSTDIYLPIMQDCLLVPFEYNGQIHQVELIPRYTQYIVYDTTSGPTQYALPVVFSRTPYNASSDNLLGSLFSIMGYAFVFQDMRGRYSSEGIYFPMYSDGWEKYPYHPTISLPMDPFSITNPSNALHHTDGRDAIFYIVDSLKRLYDIDQDGTFEMFSLCNGNIGMFGASALGNSQFQALASIPYTHPNPLKCLMPLVATAEHYNTTLFNNGVFRYSLVDGWIRGQMQSLNEYLNDIDTSYVNELHTPRDYGVSTIAEVVDSLLSFLVEKKIGQSPSGAYPNSILRKDLDVSCAPINAMGTSDSMGNFSRYLNFTVPIYHITGWWDIFVDGQIETFNRIRSVYPHLKQILIVGPWAHQTIGTKKTGDIEYPENVTDVLGIDFDKLYSGDLSSLSELYPSELLCWYRKYLGGEPYFYIPRASKWQQAGDLLIKIPSNNYYVPYYKFLNYLGGCGTLDSIPCEILMGNFHIYTKVPVLSLQNPLFVLDKPVEPCNPEYFDQVSPVRVYVGGPIYDTSNYGIGNFWIGLDSFPFRSNIYFHRYYLQKNGNLSPTSPLSTEEEKSYIADPYHPVITVGGNNMIPEVPGGGQKSQGSINLANPQYAPFTLQRSDVLHFETPPLSDMLLIIGFPKASIWVKGELTYGTHINFDLIVRIIDVYPDGREMFITEGAVNVRAREYARALFLDEYPDTVTFSNATQGTYYNLQFKLLPMAHIFGKNHKIKILLSSSNYPRYQSNPHIPLNDGEFFLWQLGDTSGYVYNGSLYHPSPAKITFSFSATHPSYVELPVYVGTLPILTVEENEKNNEVHIYPNPVSQELFIDSLEGYVELWSLDGKKLLKMDCQGQTILPMSSFAPGIYILHIYDSSTPIFMLKKIIKN